MHLFFIQGRVKAMIDIFIFFTLFKIELINFTQKTSITKTLVTKMPSNMWEPIYKERDITHAISTVCDVKYNFKMNHISAIVASYIVCEYVELPVTEANFTIPIPTGWKFLSGGKWSQIQPNAKYCYKKLDPLIYKMNVPPYETRKRIYHVDNYRYGNIEFKISLMSFIKDDIFKVRVYVEEYGCRPHAVYHWLWKKPV
jgi:hypothetical protein